MILCKTSLLDNIEEIPVILLYQKFPMFLVMPFKSFSLLWKTVGVNCFQVQLFYMSLSVAILCWVTTCTLGLRMQVRDPLDSRGVNLGKQQLGLFLIHHTTWHFLLTAIHQICFLPSRHRIPWGPSCSPQLRSPPRCAMLFLLIAVKLHRKSSLKALICAKIWWINKLVYSEFVELFSTLNRSVHSILITESDTKKYVLKCLEVIGLKCKTD